MLADWDYDADWLRKALQANRSRLRILGRKFCVRPVEHDKRRNCHALAMSPEAGPSIRQAVPGALPYVPGAPGNWA
ncbi:hypothetical protein GCM10027407_08210 [Acetobacter peroxydans]|nr:hypothetical protein AA13755_2225 [Acetobacter peroxydans NBRC 13755]